MFDTFSANSLRILEKSKTDFINKYINNLEINFQKDEQKKGNILHNLISYYLKGFDTEKMENGLFNKEVFQNFKNSKIVEFIQSQEKRFVEHPFFIKENLNGIPFFLVGRFDLVTLKDNFYTIFDWKIKSTPKEPEDDIQTVVYIYALSKLFKTENIKMVYYSLENQTSVSINYSDGYLKRIKDIVQKFLN